MNIETYQRKRRELLNAARNANLAKQPLLALQKKCTYKEDEKWKKTRQRVVKHHRHIVMGMVVAREAYYGRIRRENMKTILAPILPLFEAFASCNVPLWIVGGAVRNAVLGNKIEDYDFVAQCSPEQIAEILKSEAIKANVYREHMGTVSCMFKEFSVQVSALKGPDIQTDVLMRDFTVNAVALDKDMTFASEDVERFYKDLAGKKALRTPLDPMKAFVADPVRIMRMYRFAQALSVDIDGATRNAARATACSLTTVARERVAKEFSEILKGKNPHVYLRMMMEDGVLQQLIPELAMQVGWDQAYPKFPLPLWEHTLKVVQEAHAINSSWRTIFAALLSSVSKPFIYKNAVSCAACNHTYFLAQGKTLLECSACTKRPSEVGPFVDRGKSYDGLMQGNCTLANKVLHRFKLSNEDREFVLTLVSGYQFYNDVKEWDKATVRRFVHKLGSHWKPMINLMKATTRAQSEKHNSLATINKLRMAITALGEPEIKRLVDGTLPVTGNEVAEAAGVALDHTLKPLMLMVKQAVVDGVVATKEQAINLVKMTKKHK